VTPGYLGFVYQAKGLGKRVALSEMSIPGMTVLRVQGDQAADARERERRRNVTARDMVFCFVPFLHVLELVVVGLPPCIGRG